jgi:hypothetical protein
MSEQDRSYYRRRAAEELMAMHRTKGPAANAHKILAERYTALVEDEALAPTGGAGLAKVCRSR